MVNLEKLLNKPKVFSRLTGLTPLKFPWLLERVEPRFLENDRKRKDRPERIRAIGAGPKRKLSVGQALFGLLLYDRTYVNHVFLGMLLGINDGNVGRYFGKIEPLLAGIFKIPERKIDLSEDEVMELIIDATEQPSERRSGSGYSGKKKRQTVKVQIAVNKKGKIKAVSKKISGNVHDKKLYDKARMFTRKRVRKRADLGYVGTECLTPIKKRKGIELTEKEKEYNRQFSTERIVVEHSLACMKKFQILAQRLRNPIRKYTLIFKNIAGLRNLQMETVTP